MLLGPFGDADRADKIITPAWQSQENSIVEKNSGFPLSIFGLSEALYLLILLRGLSLLSRIACFLRQYRIQRNIGWQNEEASPDP
jgi:hypothetical protein